MDSGFSSARTGLRGRRGRRRLTMLATGAALGVSTVLATAGPAAAGPGPFYWIVNVNSGKALMPYNHSKTAGTDIVQATKGNYGAQNWKILGSGTARVLQNRHSKQCIVVSVYGDHRLFQNACQDTPGGASQARTTWHASNYNAMWAGNPVLWTSSYSGKCMDIWGASTAENEIAQQYTCHGGTNQQFRLVHVPGT